MKLTPHRPSLNSAIRLCLLMVAMPAPGFPQGAPPLWFHSMPCSYKNYGYCVRIMRHWLKGQGQSLRRILSSSLNKSFQTLARIMWKTYHHSTPWPEILIQYFQVRKTKINKWEGIRVKSFYKAEEAIDKMERWPIEWEKTFVNHISNKGLIYISKPHNSIAKTPNNLI